MCGGEQAGWSPPYFDLAPQRRESILTETHLPAGEYFNTADRERESSGRRPFHESRRSIGFMVSLQTARYHGSST